MKKHLVLVSLFSLFISAPAFADKPSWAGQGGKPSETEREMHKNAMRDKGGNKNKDKSRRENDDDHMEREHQRQEMREHSEDSTQQAERMKQQSPIQNAHEAVHDAAQVHEAAETVKKWYEFWKK